MAPSLFGIFFSLIQFCSEGILLHASHNRKPLNLTRLHAKTKVKTVLLREMLFADDADFVSYTVTGLQAILHVDLFATSP